nr:MAG TPA: receptor binding protein [Caudoviricetes sp.]
MPIVEKFKIDNIDVEIADAESRANIVSLQRNKANNSDFNTQYSGITGTLIDGRICNRKGNISLELDGNTLKSTLSANTWTKILTLPDGYRPISKIFRTVTFAGAYSVILEINTSGTVNAYTTSTLYTGVSCYDGVEFI